MIGRLHSIRNWCVGLLLACMVGGCASAPASAPSNEALRRSIYDAVPDAWRDAVASTAEIAPLTITPDLFEFIHSSVRSNDQPRDRILALTSAIVDSDGLGLTYDPDATLTASEAYRSGTANCLGFSNLLVASARELGLTANYELVSHRLRWQKVGKVLVGTMHVRVASIVSGKRMSFDFYPLPLESGHTTGALTDAEALAHHFNNLAVSAMQDGDDARAYGLLYKAIEVSPRIAFIWSNLGTLLSREQLDALAEAAFGEALLISPEALSALSSLQRLYTRQERHAEARELEDRLREYRDNNPYYQLQRGEQAYAKGDYEDAVEYYKEAIRLDDDIPEFYAGLSEAYARLGKSKAASKAARKVKAIEDSKDNIDASSASAR